jgi:RIO kinase 1
MWQHFENGELTPEIELTGVFEADEHEADVDSILEEIKVAYLEEQARLERMAESDE